MHLASSKTASLYCASSDSSMQIRRLEITLISVHLAPISRSGFALIGRQERLGFQYPFWADLMVASVAHFVSGTSSGFYGAVLAPKYWRGPCDVWRVSKTQSLCFTLSDLRTIRRSENVVVSADIAPTFKQLPFPDRLLDRVAVVMPPAESCQKELETGTRKARVNLNKRLFPPS